jgi:hypothetical protein
MTQIKRVHQSVQSKILDQHKINCVNPDEKQEKSVLFICCEARCALDETQVTGWGPIETVDYILITCTFRRFLDDVGGAPTDQLMGS